MSDTFRAMCAELLAWADHASSHYYIRPALFDRALTLLAQPEPEGLTAVKISALLNPAYEITGGEIAEGAQLIDGEWWNPVMGCDSLQMVVDNARAAIAADRACRPTLQPPADGEIDDFIHRWWEAYGKGYLPNLSDKALVADALAFWGNPTPQSPSPQSP